MQSVAGIMVQSILPTLPESIEFEIRSSDLVRGPAKYFGYVLLNRHTGCFIYEIDGSLKLLLDSGCALRPLVEHMAATPNPTPLDRANYKNAVLHAFKTLPASNRIELAHPDAVGQLETILTTWAGLPQSCSNQD